MGWESRCVASVTGNMREGQMWAKNLPERSWLPLLQFYACFKNTFLLTTVQFFGRRTKLSSIWYTHFITNHSLNILILPHPLSLSKIELPQRTKPNPQGHKDLKKLRMPSVTLSAEVKGDSWTRSEGKSQPHNKGNHTLLNRKTKT